MKNLFFAAFAVFAFTSINAQSFGALGGLSLLSAKVEQSGFQGSKDSQAGFHFGAFGEFKISDQFAIQPELTFTIAGDVSIFSINGIAKYYVAEGFNVQAGPQIGFVGGDFAKSIDTYDSGSKLNFQLAFGSGYDITENVFVQARYGFQLNNHYTGSVDAKSKLTGFLFTVGYKFI
ncbi:outer membrane beta-barrel protein [Winogradskyella thalassocola]|uniref:Outer membrane protein beta-barrel domain-containing protein n=1 Tax=Winogradskyella thalassocola TaxID=262004 RepID=A0A1G8L4Y1_9FLAO|nr:outer membrane beta-barrel protein [Winogradskyella thalassocola]SDI50240.1 Outer membrane protein beta-barrel domain-containing protein [Winogradskyella thalassocola]